MRKNSRGETDRKQFTRVVILIIEFFNHPLIECDRGDALATSLSQALEVTQAAVSQQIASLEQQRGAQLFSRRGRRIKLTEQGRHFYRYTRKALELLDKAGRDLAHAKDTVTGKLHIASCTIPVEAFLPEVLSVFRQAYPRVHKAMSVSNTTEVMRRIAAGEADVGFVVVQPQSAPPRGKS